MKRIQEDVEEDDDVNGEAKVISFLFLFLFLFFLVIILFCDLKVVETDKCTLGKKIEVLFGFHKFYPR